MSCIPTSVLTDHQLLAYIDGEAEPAVRNHIAGCAVCRQRVDALRRAEAKLSIMLTEGAACPSPTVLEQYYAGLLSIAQENAVAAHLHNRCSACLAAVAVIMAKFADLAPAVLAEPLVSDSQQTAEKFAGFWAKLQATVTTAAPVPSSPVVPAQPPSTFADLLQRVRDGITVFIAELLTPPTPALALRGAADKLPLVYRLGEIEIRVDLQPELGTDRKVLIGQVKAPPAALLGLQVDLWQDAQAIAGTPVDSKRGRFQLPALSPGNYTLVVRSAEWEIHLPHLVCQ